PPAHQSLAPIPCGICPPTLPDACAIRLSRRLSYRARCTPRLPSADTLPHWLSLTSVTSKHSIAAITPAWWAGSAPTEMANGHWPCVARYTPTARNCVFMQAPGRWRVQTPTARSVKPPPRWKRSCAPSAKDLLDLFKGFSRSLTCCLVNSLTRQHVC